MESPSRRFRLSKMRKCNGRVGEQHANTNCLCVPVLLYSFGSVLNRVRPVKE